MSISQHLQLHHGIQVDPGKKAPCPMCHSKNKTLSVRRDDTLAKCFRCGHYLLLRDDGTIYESYARSASPTKAEGATK